MMCGNASRCIGKYVYEKGLTNKEVVSLETLSGIKYLQLHLDRANKVESVTVDMGEPLVLEPSLVLEAGTDSFKGTAVSMGNPHYVIKVDDISKIELSKVGPLLENHSHFPNRTNVEFAQTLDDGSVRMRVWERGSGITQACGTGACATAVAFIAQGDAKQDEEIPIAMDGGILKIRWNSKDNHIYMTGGAEIVYEGSIDI